MGSCAVLPYLAWGLSCVSSQVLSEAGVILRPGSDARMAEPSSQCYSRASLCVDSPAEQPDFLHGAQNSQKCKSKSFQSWAVIDSFG